MDLSSTRSRVIAGWFLIHSIGSLAASQAGTPNIQFDMPAVAVAIDTSAPGEARHVSCELVLSSLVVDTVEDHLQDSPPINHLLVRCRLRDRLPVTDYAPKTELQSDYSSAIAITKKDERSESFGINVDGTYHPFGAGHFGSDDTEKQSDSTQYERQAPMQAVIASGTTDRGRGVYFKLRWTTRQVLEGEKRFQISFAVPAAWRGGLVDVSVTANAIEHPLFGSPKLRVVAEREFVVAVHQQHDAHAAAISLRLAELDRELADYSKQHPGPPANAISGWWRRVVKPGDQGSPWYRGITASEIDPYVDREIQALPMPVRVAVLGYTDAARELMELDL